MTQATREFLENSEKLYREWEKATEARGEARCEARGEARGEARAVLAVLEARGIMVSEEQRAFLLAMTDVAWLEAKIRAAVTVQSASELFDSTVPASTQATKRPGKSSKNR